MMCSEPPYMLFRPWESSLDIKDEKFVLKSKLNTGDSLAYSSPERELLNKIRRHHHDSDIRVNKEPCDAPSEMVSERAPLSVAMRGLVYRQAYSRLYTLSEHLKHVSRVQATCQLQLALASMMTGSAHDKKKYRCEECGARFNSNGNLRGHLRIHTGRRKQRYNVDFDT